MYIKNELPDIAKRVFSIIKEGDVQFGISDPELIDLAIVSHVSTELLESMGYEDDELRKALINMFLLGKTMGKNEESSK